MNTKTRTLTTLLLLTACPIEGDPALRDPSSTTGSSEDPGGVTSGSGGSTDTSSSLGPEETTGSPDLGSSSSEGSSGLMEEGSSSTGEEASSSEGGSTTGILDSDSTSESSSSGTTGEDPVEGTTMDPLPPSECGNYMKEPGEDCDVWKPPTSMCDVDCTWAECGDGILNPTAGELCDDGNTVDGDGCKSDCSRWDWHGVAYNVPTSALVGWKPCNISNYSFDGGNINTLYNCNLGQMLIGCSYYDGQGQEETMFMAGHAPKNDVMKAVDYYAGEEFVANGVGWHWSPHKGVIAMSEPGPQGMWQLQGEDQQMAWRIGIQDGFNVFLQGGRCGPHLFGNKGEGASFWRRIAFTAPT